MTTLTAVNTDPHSENRMHADEVARQYGFLGGLVPGVDVFEYMARIALEKEPQWLHGGSGELRLRRPYYDGETVRIQVNEEGAAVTADDRASLTFRAGIPPNPPEIPPFRELPGERPPASVETLAEGLVLGSLRKSMENQDAHSRKAREILELANRIIMRNVVLQPWIHTGSVIHWLPGFEELVEVEARGRIIAQNERKGHGFVTLRLVLCDAQRGMTPAAWLDHTAIWRYVTS